jgi:hypothetical protein
MQRKAFARVESERMPFPANDLGRGGGFFLDSSSSQKNVQNLPRLTTFSNPSVTRPSATWEWLGRRAYAVYIIHPPVLVGISLPLHGWVAPALAKFAVVGALTCIATWLLADPLVRLPEVRRVV